LVDPETSLRRRVDLLRDVAIESVTETVAEVPLFNHLSDLVRELRSRAWIVTANLDVWIEPFVRSRFPDARLLCSRAVTANGRAIAISTYLNKAAAISAMRREHPRSRVVAVGEGANDVPMLRAADAAVTFFAVHTPAPSAIECADFFVKTEARLCQLLRRL
jgi:phosphoserine phosphatase